MIVYWISTTITWYVNCPSSEKLSNSPLCDAVNVEQNPKNIVVGDPPQGGSPQYVDAVNVEQIPKNLIGLPPLRGVRLRP